MNAKTHRMTGFDMRASTITKTIECDEDVALHMTALLDKAPKLVPIAEIAGPVPLRRTSPGLSSLARIICGQQVSTSAAASIYARLESQLGSVTDALVIDAGFEGLRVAGLSTPKAKTLLAVAEAEQRAEIDLYGLCALPAERAIETMTAIKGIGPWTAEVYLLFAAGHPDIFPSGDLALQNAIQHAFRKRKRPDAKAVAALSRKWRPHRGVAARLFWAYYAATTGRAGV